MSCETADIEYCDQKETTGLPRAHPSNLFVLDPLSDKRWASLVTRHPASSVFHSLEWLSALRQTYDYEPVVFTTCDPSAELTSGIVFCKVKSWLTGRRLVSLPFSDHCDPLVENAEEFDNLLQPVRESIEGGKWDYCELRPVSFDPGEVTKLGQSDRYCLHTIDLRPSIGAIFQNFHKNSVQRKIRRAEREALAYEEGNSERLLRHFYKLIVATRRRHYLPPQPLKWFRSLMTSFGDDLKIRVVFKDGAAIASIVTLIHKNTVIYKYGASDARIHPSGGMALLLWNTIQEARDAGYERLDLGRSDLYNEGLIAYKEHWGGIRSDLSYWRYPNRPRSHESSRKRLLAERIVHALPDRLLAAAGDVFYRHIG